MVLWPRNVALPSGWVWIPREAEARLWKQLWATLGTETYYPIRKV